MPAGRTRPLVTAAVVLAVEALVAIGFGVLEATQIRSHRPVVGAGAALLMLGYGALLAAVGRGTLRGRRWSRAPAVATQLIQLPVAWSFRGGPTTWVTLVLAGASLAVLVCVLLPSSTAVFAPASSPNEGT